MFESYLANEYYFAAAQLILAMLGMGATLGVRDFVDVVREPRAMAVGLSAQLILVPAVAWALIELLQIDPPIAAGLALVAAVPGGSMSNVATYLARGNVPLSIAMTAVSTVGCLVTTPIVLRLLMPVEVAAGIAMPAGQIAFEIACCLLLPLAFGIAIGSHLSESRLAFSRWCIRASLTVIAAMVVGAAGAGRIDIGSHGWMGPMAILLFSFLAQQAAVAASRIAGVTGRDRTAIAIEVTIRNTNLALLIKASLFPVVAGVADPIADGALFVALLYGGVALLVVLPPCVVHRRMEAASAPYLLQGQPGLAEVDSPET
jgi:BASS family bile acid:Na+ symporter